MKTSAAAVEIWSGLDLRRTTGGVRTEAMGSIFINIRKRASAFANKIALLPCNIK